MIKSLTLGLYKSIYYKKFWLISGLTFALWALLLFVLKTFMSSSSSMGLPLSALLSFPNVWPNLALMGHYVSYFLALSLILVITNDFTYQTLKHEIALGMSIPKMVLTYFFISLFLSVLIILGIFLFLFMFSDGFLHITEVFSLMGLKISLLLTLQNICVFSFVILMSLLFRQPIICLALFYAWVLFIEPSIEATIKMKFEKDALMPFVAFSNLLPSFAFNAGSEVVLPTLKDIQFAMLYLLAFISLSLGSLKIRL